MRRVSLTSYDNYYPQGMLLYLRFNGPHFNKKLLEFANSKMYKIEGGKRQKINFMGKEEVDRILRQHKIEINNNQLYDYVYVANMCLADFLHSSIADELHLALYIKDVIDDPDAEDGYVFNRWYADMCYSGIPIDWEEVV